MITDAIHRIAMHRAELSRDEAQAVMGEILAGRATDSQIGAFLTALAMRGETVEEIVGFAQAIRGAAAQIKLRRDSGAPAEPGSSSVGSGSALDVSGTERDALVDTCGTGGDVSDTFNISTATALVVAGAGVRVAKHGNRSVSSKCGSADVLEALGVNIALPIERVAECVDQVGIGFLFAPAVHSAMRYANPARRELKFRTVFNLLGPLTNPAGASCQVVGVYSLELVPKLGEALRLLGLRHALVVHGDDGLDEITTTTTTKVAEVRDNRVLEYELTPEQFGIARPILIALKGGDAQENAGFIRSILKGEHTAKRDIVVLNAAAALFVAAKATSIMDAIPLAEHSIDSGAMREKLEKLVEFTNA